MFLTIVFLLVNIVLYSSKFILFLLSVHNLDSNSKLSIRLPNCSDIVSKYEYLLVYSKDKTGIFTSAKNASGYNTLIPSK